MMDFRNRWLTCRLPITELPGPNAHTHGHSEGTVKLAKAHWDSTYCPRKVIFDSLQKETSYQFNEKLKTYFVQLHNTYHMKYDYSYIVYEIGCYYCHKHFNISRPKQRYFGHFNVSHKIKIHIRWSFIQWCIFQCKYVHGSFVTWRTEVRRIMTEVDTKWSEKVS